MTGKHQGSARSRAVLIPLLVYGTLFAVFYPQTFASPDEASYLANAQAIVDGDLFDRTARALYSDAPGQGEGRFKGRTLLFPLLISPLLAIDWKVVFLFGLACHLAVFLLVVEVFRKTDFSPWWALLVLVQPTLTLGSRMVMTDGLGNLLAIAVVWLLLEKRNRPIAVAVIAGLGLFIRPTNLLLLVAAGVHFLVSDLKGCEPKQRGARLLKGQALRFALASLLIGVLFLLHNWALYGGPLMTAYHSSTLVQFGVEYVIRFFPIRLLSLNVFWPFLLVAVIFLPRRIRAFGIAYVLVSLLFYSSCSAFERGHDLVSTLVRSARYFSGPIVVLCLGYPAMVQAALRGKKVGKVIPVLAATCCLLATTALFWKHDRFLANQQAAVEFVNQRIPPGSFVWTDSVANELFHPVWGECETDSIYHSYFNRRLKGVDAGHYIVWRSQPPPRTSGQERFHQTNLYLVKALQKHMAIEEVASSQSDGLLIFRVQAAPQEPLPPLTVSESKMWWNISREWTNPILTDSAGDS